MSYETIVVESPEAPFTTEQRLAIAYGGGGAPPNIAQFFAWGHSSGYVTVDQNYQAGEMARSIARSINARAEVAYGRVAEAEQRIADLEKRLLELRVQHAKARAYLAGDPPVTADPWDVGKVAVLKDGCERLLPVVERALETARTGPERAREDADNWRILSDLADVIAGIRGPTDLLARKLGLEGAWQICPPLLRVGRERQRREAAAAELAARPERESERREAALRESEREAAERAKVARFAEIDSMGLEGLISCVFFGGQKLSLDEIKKLVARWDEHLTLKELIRLWPEPPDTNLYLGAKRDLDEIIRTGDSAYNHAVRRLARAIQPGWQGENQCGA
jgi:hypothetical protein